MSVIHRLATSLERKDEEPNKELAKIIVDTNNIEGISELIEHLQNNKNRKIQNDCIKTLYEIGNIKPELISEYIKVFVNILMSKNNRLVWGSMIALNTITEIVMDEVYVNLSYIMRAIDKATVITRDAGVSILAKLSANEKYAKIVFPLLLEQMKFCPVNQIGQYAEKTLPAINNENKEEFVNVLYEREFDLETNPQRKRLNKIFNILKDS